MAAVCLLIHASVSPDGEDWTAPVVSVPLCLNLKKNIYIFLLDSFIPDVVSQPVGP